MIMIKFLFTKFDLNYKIFYNHLILLIESNNAEEI